MYPKCNNPVRYMLFRCAIRYINRTHIFAGNAELETEDEHQPCPSKDLVEHRPEAEAVL